MKLWRTCCRLLPPIKTSDDLINEEDELAFVQAFRKLMPAKNVLITYTDFRWADLDMDEQTFENYKSKYLDLYDKIKNDRQKQKTSILDDIDFELELIHRDEINVAYILKLLARLKKAKSADAEQQKEAIVDQMAGEVELRSKRELIEKFIEENLPHIEDVDAISDEFERYWQEQKVLALSRLCETENLDQKQFNALIESYIFSTRNPFIYFQVLG